ncbi:ribonuclease J [Gluconobacter sphaericus]|uniref:MBL fold hydrolase n=1 Tax=Gluconobacter sphaericus NBRC 12467 TaxID=1307951 RepID=A0AA37W9T8_9PROT|nr:ribonuclease J [Gluconobacter sphaericus]MBF0885276.1 ribonuclease J [Gluconobacter sphaericus]MBS1085024.1 ribonuclease J [Gluconobacter sphaericus]MBS1096127.1 ribonuclease J [Gluconobacter sphaericus]MBS1098758.1 ribonuclease J [Gluconobacter sphaericus]QQX91160.1 ribonuclease J [Gluconobacter sphaericus]
MTEKQDGLSFLPLGGTGEIGMNFNLYCLTKNGNDTWLAIDCGIGFSGNDTPEAEVLMPDPTFIADRARDLCGLVITHAHEDHLGAVAHLWPYLRCPVYATPFAAAVLRRKLQEAHLNNQVKIHVIRPASRFEVGPFDLQFVSVTHSVAEAQAVALRTPHGLIVHTGDWKLDENPLVGPVTDLETFGKLGDEGVLAMVGDSTNVLKPGKSESEADVRKGLTDLIMGLEGRIAVTCFASNVARVESIAKAAQASGRVVMIVGRSLRNLETAARECGYFQDLPPFLTEQDARDVDDDSLLMIITGSQGEPRSALSRIASDTHPNIALGEGDTVIYSSRMIPGNEQAVMAVQDNLSRRGVTVLTDKDAKVHTSGHATSEDIRTLYRIVRPKYSIPTHGEWRHLTAHAALAHEMGSEPILLEDGDILNLSPGEVKVVDTAPTGRLALDGGRLLPMTGGVLAARRKMLFNGIVLASFAVDDEGYVIGEPKISAPGLLESDDPESIRIQEEFADSIDQIPDELRQDDAAFRDAAKTALRRALGRKLQKRPLVDVHLLRV